MKTLNLNQIQYNLLRNGAAFKRLFVIKNKAPLVWSFISIKSQNLITL